MPKQKYIIVALCLIYSLMSSAVVLHAQINTSSIINDIAYSPDGRLLAVASSPSQCDLAENEYKVIILDTQTLSPIRSLAGLSCPINNIAWSPEGETIVGSGSEGISIVWDVRTGNQVSISDHIAPSSSNLAWNPEGTLYIGRTGGNAYIFDATTGKIVYTLTGNTSISAIDWGTNNVIAYGDIYGQIRLLNYTTQHESNNIKHHDNHIGLIKWDQQATKFASVDRDNRVNIWHANGELIQTFGFDTYVTELVWNPDGTQIIIGKIDEGAEIWDVTTGKKIVDIVIDQPLSAIDWSPDSNQIAYGSYPLEDALIQVVEVSTLIAPRPVTKD